MKQRYVTTLLFLLSVVVCYSEEIKIQDMGDASLEAEGDVTSDTYGRSQNPFRGRYSDKL